MRIYHRFLLGEDRKSSFTRLGLDCGKYVIGSNSAFDIVRVDETDSVWPQVKQALARLNIITTIETEFADEEIGESPCVRLLSSSFTGFPEPKDNHIRVFDSAYESYCSTCGMYGRQVAPFKLAGEPNWGRRQTFQTHWTIGELFVKKETWSSVFLPFGISHWPVLHLSGHELNTVVQLRIDEMIDLSLPSAFKARLCATCGRSKYMPFDRGFWPLPQRLDVPLFKSAQFFGDGGEADPAILVSHELYVAMTGAKLNCKYWACR